jgi:hypothetical protein
MKKLLVPVMLGLLCAPVGADQSLHDFVRELGYKGDYIMENLPKDSRPQLKKTVPVRTSYVAPQRDLFHPDDLLHPRIMQRSESPRMIPVLMRYHRKNPASAKITRKLAVTCIRNGQPREALYWYTQTWQRDRSDYESLWNMACISYRLGQTDLTKKYLEEYAKVDPNSAWGRMSREFLAGRFSGSDLADGFKSGLAQTGDVVGTAEKKPSAGVRVSEEAKSSPSGIMVIEGQRTTFNRFMSGYDEIDSAPIKKVDTAKGKQKVRSKMKVEAEVGKTSLQKAAIIKKSVNKAEAAPVIAAPLTETKAVTATAPPLVP